MQRKVMLILGCLSLAGPGCGSRPTPVQTEHTQEQLRVIVHLETRNEITTVMSGREGCVYTVRAKDGRMLEEQISEQELWTKFPAIYHLLKTSYAGGGAGGTTWAGGSLRPSEKAAVRRALKE
ncbi:MAG: hypothetical protein ACYSWQ_01880 [Planctomycetota bacterium]|jgi:hypothetical protein